MNPNQFSKNNIFDQNNILDKNNIVDHALHKIKHNEICLSLAQLSSTFFLSQSRNVNYIINTHHVLLIFHKIYIMLTYKCSKPICQSQ